MAQPAANTAEADALIGLYQQAQESLLQQIAVAIEPGQEVARRRLRELLVAVDDEIARLQIATHVWITTRLPVVYATGATAAATHVGTAFTWTLAHTEAVQALAERTWSELLSATTFVADDTKAIIRRLAAQASRRAVLEGVTPVQAGAELAAAVQSATGAVTVVYANGARMPLAAHAEMTVRTETALAHNSGTFTQAREDGFAQMEVVDGLGCGWTEHDDPDGADGSIRDLADCEEFPISHPNCARSFFPVAGGDEVTIG